MDNSTAAGKLQKAKASLLIHQPFFGNLILGMRYVETDKLPVKTMGVDGKNIYYDVNFVMGLDLKSLQGTLCHEVLHVALSHLARRHKQYDKMKWNIACDYAVNLMIDKVPELRLPEGALLNYKYEGMTAEEIYKSLPDDCSYGNGFQDVHGDMSDADEQEVIRRVIAAAEACSNDERGQGYIPDEIKRLIDRIKNPKLDWRRFIKATAVDYFSRRDYMWERGNRMFAHMGLYLPSLLGTTNNTLAIGVDTSGSISEKILADFASEMKGIIELADNTIVISCDAAVHDVAEVTSFSDLLKEIKFQGGGGTDFRPVFGKLTEMNVTPDVLIYLTDGYGTFPEHSPNYPVIFARIEHSLAAEQFPFGQVVTLKDD